MAILQIATSSTFRLGIVVLLASLTASFARAQDPVSPDLSLPLTDTPDAALTTTLAIDLLAPGRPFVFDPTGASVSANALDPSIDASSRGVSIAQTDTAIRDSSQTGQLSPYGPSAQQLRIGFSSTSRAGNSSEPAALRGETSGQQYGARVSHESSWGSSSSFGRQSNASSWGTGRMGVDELEQAQPASVTASRGQNGATAANNLAHSTRGYSSAKVNSPGSRFNKADLRSSPNSSFGSASQRSDSELTRREIRPAVGPMANPMMNTGMAAPALTFFPQAYAEAPLGESPFSSPSGFGELNFLSPNIFAPTSRGRSLSFPGRGKADSAEMQQAFVHRDTLAASASHYGLTTRPPANRPSTNLGAVPRRTRD